MMMTVQKEKLLREIRVSKRKGRHRDQKALESRLENVSILFYFILLHSMTRMTMIDVQIIKRLNEDKGLTTADTPSIVSSRFEEVRSLRVLLEPDYSIGLRLHVLVRAKAGFIPAVKEFTISGLVVCCLSD